MDNQSVLSVIKFVEQIIGFTYEDLIKTTASGFSGSMLTYNNSKALVDIYNAFNSNNYDVAYIYAMNCIRDNICSKKITTEIYSKDTLLDFSNKCYRAALLLDDYENWHESNKIEIANYLKTSGFFANASFDDIKNLNMDCTDIYKCEQILKNSNLLRTYRYKGTGQLDINSVSNIIIKDVIFATDNINTLMNSIKTYNDNSVYVNLFMKIEQCIDLSYFIIAVTYNDNIFIVTDQVKFNRPDGANKVRRPGKYSEKREENLNLPYYIIDSIIAERENTLAKTSADELFIKKLTDYLSIDDLAYLKILFDNIVKYISTDKNYEKLYTGVEYFNEIKALPCGEIVLSDTDIKTSFNSINYEENLKFFEETFGELDSTTTDIAIRNSDNTSILEKYGNNLLTTFDDYTSHIMYTSVKSRADKIADKCKVTDAEYLDSRTKLINKFKENAASIYDIIMSASNVYLYDIDDPVWNSRFGVGDEGKPKIKLLSKCLDKCHVNTSFYVYEHANTSKAQCMHCAKHFTNSGIQLYIDSYKELMLLLQCSRKDLPKAYQYYFSDKVKPYHGNELLDNVNPLFTIPMPINKYHPADIKIYFSTCKRCMQKRIKTEEVVLVYSSKQNKIIKFCDKSEII